MTVNQFTQNLMEKFPSWMKLAKDENSIGAQFLDVFGISLNEFDEEMKKLIDDFYIGTAHIENIDIIYKVPLANITIDDFSETPEIYIETNDGNKIMVFSAPNLRRFYKYDESYPFRGYVDRASGYLYLRVDFDSFEDINQPFKSVVINGAPQYELILHHVWNVFDEFGLLLNLKRLFGERNESFKERILDVFKNPGNSTKEGLVNGISRELGLTKFDVKIINFSEYAFNDEFINKDFTPTKKMVSYAKQINDSLKFTWDSLNLGEAYWHSISENNLGIEYLPHLWDIDTSIWNNEDFQSGIGDGNDLLVHKPKKEDSTRKFKSYISLIGYYQEVNEIYPEIKFKYKIYSKGKIPNTEYLPEEFRYTLKSSRTFNQPYNVEGEQKFNYLFRTDFYNRNKFIADDKTVFGLSNDFLHVVTDKILRIKLKMNTFSEIDTPYFGEITVNYEDNDGKIHSYSFKTRDEFLNIKNATNGQILHDVYYSGIYAEDNSLELGFGAFQKIIDSTADFQAGEYETKSILIKEGKMQLNLDLIGKEMN